MSAEINTQAEQSSKDVFDSEFDEATAEEDEDMDVDDPTLCGCSANTHNPVAY